MDEIPTESDSSLLLADVAWLRALARRLIADEAGAEDLAQETWLTYLSDPVRGRRSLRAWLASTARCIAFSWSRGERRRARRELAAARPEADAEPLDPVEQLSLQRSVVDAVLGLHEPYRTAVILRYYNDRTPREIAALRGMPDSTVRVHLTRGLRMLREDLRARLGGEDRWRGVLAPLALGAARWPSRGALPSVAALAVLAAGFLVTILAALWIALPDSGRAGGEELTRGADAADAEERGVKGEVYRRDEAPGSTGDLLADRASGNALRVQVVDHDGRPRGGIWTDLRIDPSRPAANAGGFGSQIAAGATQEEEGIVVLAIPPALRAQLKEGLLAYLTAQVNVHPSATIPIDLAHLPREVVRIELPPMGRVRVRAFDAMGGVVPIRAARIRLASIPERTPAQFGPLEDPVGAMGIRGRLPGTEEVLFDDVGLGLELRASVLPDHTSTWRDCFTGRGPGLRGEEVVFDGLLPGPVLFGRILDRDGNALSRRTCKGRLLGWSAGERRSRVFGFASDSEGRFHASVHPSTLRLRCESLWIETEPEEPGGQGLGARIALPERLATEGNNVGEICLAPLGPDNRPPQQEMLLPAEEPPADSLVRRSFRIVFESKAPLVREVIELTPLGGEQTSLHLMSNADGMVAVRVPFDHPGFLLSGEHFRPVRVSCEAEEQLVVVKASLELRIHCSDLEESLRSRFDVQLLMERESAHPEIERQGRLDERSSISFRVPEAGRYTLRWSLWRKRRMDPGEEVIAEVPAPNRIDVRDTPELQEFSVSIDPESLRDAIAKLQ